MYNLVKNDTLEVIARNASFDKLADRQSERFFDEAVSILSDAELKASLEYFRQTLDFELASPEEK